MKETAITRSEKKLGPPTSFNGVDDHARSVTAALRPPVLEPLVRLLNDDDCRIDHGAMAIRCRREHYVAVRPVAL